MFCPKCGNQVPDGAKFCGRCGATITIPVQPVAQTTQAQSPVAVQPQAVRPVAAGTAARPVARAMPIAAAGSQAPIIANVPFLTMKNVGYIALAACALGIIGFFLPFGGISAFGLEASVSGLQMVTGVEILGSTMEGDPLNLLLVVPSVVGFLVTLLVGGKVRWIIDIACGVLQLLLLISSNVYISDNFGSYASMGIGFWFLTAGAVMLLAGGVLGFLGARKGMA